MRWGRVVRSSTLVHIHEKRRTNIRNITVRSYPTVIRTGETLLPCIFRFTLSTKIITVCDTQYDLGQQETPVGGGGGRLNFAQQFCEFDAKFWQRFLGVQKKIVCGSFYIISIFSRVVDQEISIWIFKQKIIQNDPRSMLLHSINNASHIKRSASNSQKRWAKFNCSIIIPNAAYPRVFCTVFIKLNRQRCKLTNIPRSMLCFSRRRSASSDWGLAKGLNCGWVLRHALACVWLGYAHNNPSM